MTLEERRPVYERQRELLTELVVELTKTAPGSLDPLCASAWRNAADDAGRLRAVIDQVANVTDPRAIAWHQALVPTSTGT